MILNWCLGTTGVSDARFWAEVALACAIATILVVFAIIIFIGWIKIRNTLGTQMFIPPPPHIPFV